MNIVGIVAEYNPFHNGHLYHLQAAREATGAQAAICVMSGHFLQRGGPAMANKWARAQMALASGVDLVFELPFAYATRSANLFAWGSVSLLAATGLVTHLAFGSESGNLDDLQTVAAVLEEEPPLFRSCLHEELDRGCGFAAARATALRRYLAAKRYSPHLGHLLSQPNNILAVEYLRVLMHLQSPIHPVIIRREASAYHSSSFDRQNSNLPIASASAIRAALGESSPAVDFDHGRSNPLEVVRRFLPGPAFRILSEEIEAGRAPVGEDSLSGIILASLRRAAPETLNLLPDMEPGLEHRIKAAAGEATTFSELVDRVTTKRYPASRIRRLLVHFLVGLTGERDRLYRDAGGPQYLRLLGSTATGRKLLRLMTETARLPLIHRVAACSHRFNDPAADMLSLDLLASDLYVLLYPGQGVRGGMDYLNSPICLD